MNGLRMFNNFEEMYCVMQYLKDGKWFDMEERATLTLEEVTYLQSKLPDLDYEIYIKEEELNFLKDKRRFIIDNL